MEKKNAKKRAILVVAFLFLFDFIFFLIQTVLFVS